MNLHRIRIFHSTAGADSFHSWLDQFSQNVEAATEFDEVPNEMPSIRQSVDSDIEYYQGELAFAWTEDKAEILDNIDQYAAAYCDWHRIGYHVCTHDEDDPQPCSWDDVRENGATIPDSVPNLE